MSTSTTNLGLIKPADNETADIDVINDNMDTIDTAVAALRDSVSYVDYTATTGTTTFDGSYYVDISVAVSGKTVLCVMPAAYANTNVTVANTYTYWPNIIRVFASAPSREVKVRVVYLSV